MLSAGLACRSSGGAVVYVTAYAFVSIGLVGGYVARRTASIGPSLILATILNAVLIHFAG